MDSPFLIYYTPWLVLAATEYSPGSVTSTKRCTQHSMHHSSLSSSVTLKVMPLLHPDMPLLVAVEGIFPLEPTARMMSSLSLKPKRVAESESDFTDWSGSSRFSVALGLASQNLKSLLSYAMKLACTSEPSCSYKGCTSCGNILKLHLM